MKLWAFLLILAIPFVVFAQDEDDEDTGEGYSYVGVDRCKTCHRKPDQGEQLKIWENSAHAKAFKTLKSEEAQKIAKEKGLKVAAHEAPECLSCHVTGYDAEPAMLGKKFNVEDGVQCETCHGPGSKYRKKKIMEDRQASIDAGMTPILVSDGTAKKQCVECHNEKSPTFKGFDFDKMWKEIAHPVPAAK